MLWTEDPAHPFTGIVEKLKRAYESIGNLNTEALAFFKSSEYPVMPKADSQEWQVALDYHRALVIPRRLSVLSGEIVHQLRSSLDHVAWHFSSARYRAEHESAIEFPVFREKPVARDALARYERKVKGIVNAAIRSLIDGMQPYNRGNDAGSDPVCIIHDMDRFDKHRELMIVASCANIRFPVMPGPEVTIALTKYSQREPLTDIETALATNAVKQDAVVVPTIAFSKFGNREGQPTVPALLQLHQAIFERIALFNDLL